MRLLTGRKARQFFQLIEAVTERVGSTVYLVPFCIMLLITFEVVLRYVFNSPTIWIWPINGQLIGLAILFAGGYALLHGRHIRIELLHKRFGSRLKSVSNVLTLFFFLLFVGVLLWQGYEMAEISFTNREQLTGVFRMPIYPLKMVIPLAVLLFLLQGVASFFLRKGNIEPE